jgi:hypothetical protein
VAAGVLAVSACGENTGRPPGATETPGLSMSYPTSFPPTPEPQPPASTSSGLYPPIAVASGPVKFTPCEVTRAKAGASNLAPRVIPATEPTPVVWDLEPTGGRLTVEHVMRLALPGGWLGSGSAYDAAYATATEIQVADHDVTADVYFGVLGRGVGEAVALVELRLGEDEPVSWTQAGRLSILTDGGDGGFFSGDAGDGPENPDFDDYIDAFKKGMTGGRSNLCVTRRNEDQPRPTGFLFRTGFGDGRYPTYLGRNAQGEVVSVLQDDLLVPWALNGVPGKPPPEVAQAVAERRAGKRP